MESGTGVAPDVIAAAGAVCVRDDGQVLVIQRGTPPRQHDWSIPGGRIEAGETAEQAAIRELFEETGVCGESVGLIDVKDAIGRDQAGALLYHYVLVDFAVRWTAGVPKAGDDAAQAMFVPLAQALELVAAGDTRDVIERGVAMVGAQR